MKVTIKFEKNWAILGMTVCILLYISSIINIIPIEILRISSLGGIVFFLIVHFAVKQQETKAEEKTNSR